MPEWTNYKSDLKLNFGNTFFFKLSEISENISKMDYKDYSCKIGRKNMYIDSGQNELLRWLKTIIFILDLHLLRL